jgi:hypothetical protein
MRPALRILATVWASPYTLLGLLVGGPLMGPAYLLASLYAWLDGRRAYRDNRFEREAYGDG